MAYLTGERDSVPELLEDRVELLNTLLKKKEDDDQGGFYEALNEWLKDSTHKKSILELKKQATHLSVYYTLLKITNQYSDQKQLIC